MELSNELSSPASTSLLLVRLDVGSSLRQLLLEGVNLGCDATFHLAKTIGSQLKQGGDLRRLSIDGNDLFGELLAKACRVW